MKRFKCKYCRAKPLKENAWTVRGTQMCAECAHEYSRILDESPKKEGLKPIEILPESHVSDAFRAFKRGWEAQEELEGLEPLQIPEEIESYYETIFERHRRRKEESFKKFINDLEKNTKDPDGISENP